MPAQAFGLKIIHRSFGEISVHITFRGTDTLAFHAGDMYWFLQVLMSQK